MAALPVEAVDLEDLRGIRAGRYKRRETWKQEDQTGKILYEASMAVGNAMEGLEDVLRELAGEGDYGAAARARRVTELRKQVKEAQAVYKKIECGAKHGWSMAVAVYETHLETADMTEEEAKRLQAELKSRKKVEGENQKGGKGVKYKSTTNQPTNQPSISGGLSPNLRPSHCASQKLRNYIYSSCMMHVANRVREYITN